MTKPTLVVAVPSKGRLQENAAAFFGRAGLELKQSRGARDYRGTLSGFGNVEVAYLPSADIVAQLADGSVHLGVAGEDLLREQTRDADAQVAVLTPLGFGNADVVVAVPEAWIDVRTTGDLEDVAAIFHARRGRRMRVATKYVNLTRSFLSDRGVRDYRVVESYGATEGSPAAGTSEFIVDITTTGGTLAANGLKVLDDGVILRSQANLMASLRADWSPEARETARSILARIAAEEAARSRREVRAYVGAGASIDVADAEQRFGATALPSTDPGVRVFHSAADRVGTLADWLVASGAAPVVVTKLDYLFLATNTLWERLARRLDPRSDPHG